VSPQAHRLRRRATAKPTAAGRAATVTFVNAGAGALGERWRRWD